MSASEPVSGQSRGAKASRKAGSLKRSSIGYALVPTSGETALIWPSRFVDRGLPHDGLTPDLYQSTRFPEGANWDIYNVLQAIAWGHHFHEIGAFKLTPRWYPHDCD